MADEPAGAQPAADGEGQDAGHGLYDNLDSAPEALRPALEAELKKIEGNITKKFQAHSDYRQQWQPYEELGLNEVPPEYLQELLQFGQLAQDEDQFNDWLFQQAQERGFLGEQEPPEGEVEGEEGAGFNAEELSQTIADQINQALEERLGPMESRQREQEAADAVTGVLDELAEEHGELDDEARNTICQLAMTYAQDGGGVDSIRQAFQDYQNLMSQAQQGVFDSKTSSPRPPQKGGGADTTPQPITSFGDAKEAALASLRAAQQQ